MLLIVLCPAMVGVVTAAPDGHLFDPRDVNDTVEPGEVATPERSASHARTDTRDEREARDGWAAL